jgi:hypothetical protein
VGPGGHSDRPHRPCRSCRHSSIRASGESVLIDMRGTSCWGEGLPVGSHDAGNEPSQYWTKFTWIGCRSTRQVVGGDTGGTVRAARQRRARPDVEMIGGFTRPTGASSTSPASGCHQPPVIVSSRSRVTAPACRVVLVVIGSPVQASSKEVTVPSAVSSMRSNGSKSRESGKLAGIGSGWFVSSRRGRRSSPATR